MDVYSKMPLLIREYIDLIEEVIVTEKCGSRWRQTYNALFKRDLIIAYFKERGLFVSMSIAEECVDNYISKYGATTRRAFADKFDYDPMMGM